MAADVNLSRPVELELGKRCPSSHMEKPDHTHLCKLTAPHNGQHTCVCSTQWARPWLSQDGKPRFEVVKDPQVGWNVIDHATRTGCSVLFEITARDLAARANIDPAALRGHVNLPDYYTPGGAQ